VTDERIIKPETEFEVPVFKPKPIIKDPTTIKPPAIKPTTFEDPIVADEKQ
jgi:hypothetical protein